MEAETFARCDSLRRNVLRGAGLLAALASVGLLPRSARAAGDDPAFAATSMAEAFQALGGLPASDTDITLAMPDVVENGALVPVTITSRVPGTEAIFIVAELNPNPLAVQFTIAEGTEAFVSTRIKLAQSGRVYAAVKAQGRLYAVSRDTQVKKGGCNG